MLRKSCCREMGWRGHAKRKELVDWEGAPHKHLGCGIHAPAHVLQSPDLPCPSKAMAARGQ
eukprot:6537273-Pyramimonas_sp.AAC.1